MTFLKHHIILTLTLKLFDDSGFQIRIITENSQARDSFIETQVAFLRGRF